MLTIVFEDAAVGRFGGLWAARPACDLMLGTQTLWEMLSCFGVVHRAVRPHLARYQAVLAGRRIAVWGGCADVGLPVQPTSTSGAIVLVVNARVIPNRKNDAVLRSIVAAGRCGMISVEGVLAAAIVKPSATGGWPNDRVVNELMVGKTEAIAGLLDMGLDAIDATLQLLTQPHEILAAHEDAIQGSLAARIDSGRFVELRPGLFAAEGARIAEQIVVRQGPVVVDANAEIGPYVCLDGPLWIGRGARIHPHAWIRSGTAIGHDCRIGGEIEATVVEPFSNKAHDGFIGHSHVGSWVNLAAGTVTSNLKATYGPVRLHANAANGSRHTTHTNRQFFGALISDFVKTAINASIPCGARIGIAATVGNVVAEVVAPFTNQIVGGPLGSHTTAEQAATVLERMMARRGLECLDADRELLATLAREGNQAEETFPA